MKRAGQLSKWMWIGALLLGGAACGKETPAEKAQTSKPGLLARGTRVDATMQSGVSSRTNRIGDTLEAIVSRNVSDERSGVGIPAGSRVTLTIADLHAATDAAGAGGMLALTVNAVQVDTQAYPLAAHLQEVPHHLEWRPAASAATPSKYRDVIVSPGTPIVFTLAQTVQVTSR